MALLRPKFWAAIWLRTAEALQTTLGRNAIEGSNTVTEKLVRVQPTEHPAFSVLATIEALRSPDGCDKGRAFTWWKALRPWMPCGR